MPAYDYKCDSCGVFEVRQSIKDDALNVCPTCGGAVQRLISHNVNILFKGPGFYVTDNKGSSRKNGTTNGNGSNHDGANASEPTTSTGAQTQGSTDSKDATSKGKDNKSAASHSTSNGSSPTASSTATVTSGSGSN